MQEITYRIYADESVSNGKYYSNFYGGALAKVTDIQDIEKALNNKKRRIKFIWWNKSKNYVCSKCLCIRWIDKRTKAKEKLYKIINSNIREIRKNFNMGITTGISGNQSNYWKDPYRHWNFISSYSHFDETLTKRENKKNNKK